MATIGIKHRKLSENLCNLATIRECAVSGQVVYYKHIRSGVSALKLSEVIVKHNVPESNYCKIDTILRSIRNVASSHREIDTILRSIRNVASSHHEIDTILRSIRNVASKIVIYFTTNMLRIKCFAITCQIVLSVKT